MTLEGLIMKNSYKLALTLIAVACAVVIIVAFTNPASDQADSKDQKKTDVGRSTDTPKPRPSLTDRDPVDSPQISSKTRDLLAQLDNMDNPRSSGNSSLIIPVQPAAETQTAPAVEANPSRTLVLGESPSAPSAPSINDLLRKPSVELDTSPEPITDKGGAFIPPAASTTPNTFPQKKLTPTTRTHTIREGDYLTTIAEHYYGSQRYWEQIAQANPRVDPKRLRVGQVIRLPDAAGLKTQNTDAPMQGQTTPIPKPDGKQRIHVVTEGDTLSSIAEQHFGDQKYWSRIHQANRQAIGSNPNRIREGMRLIIPTKP